MRRRRPSRLIALPLSLWFVALTTDSGHLDACPMHHAMLAGHTSARHADATMASMASGPTMAQVEWLPDAPGTSGGDHPVQCRCIGACCGASTPTLPSSAHPLLASIVGPHQVVVSSAAGRFGQCAESHRQPPSIGPPLHHSA